MQCLAKSLCLKSSATRTSLLKFAAGTNSALLSLLCHMCERLSVVVYGKGQVFLWASSKTGQPLKTPFWYCPDCFLPERKRYFHFASTCFSCLSFFKQLLFKVILKEELVQNLLLSWPCCRQITSLLSASVFYIIKVEIVIVLQGLL